MRNPSPFPNGRKTTLPREFSRRKAEKSTPSYDYSASHRYALSFRNLSTEDAAEYVAALKAAGFAEIAAEANDASAGAMLQKGDTTLSIAYSQGAMIVLIALNG